MKSNVRKFQRTYQIYLLVAELLRIPWADWLCWSWNYLILLKFVTIRHFRVPPGLYFKTRVKKGRQNDECLSMYIINTIPHGKCFVRYLRTRSFCIRNLTRSLRSLVRFPIRQQLVSMNYSLFTRPSFQEEKGIVLALVFPSSSNCPLLFKAHTCTGGISRDRFPAISLA